MKTPTIEFDHESVLAAEHWHGGIDSMLYALCSTGHLARSSYERCRPNHLDEDRPMTDDEWIAYLADKLESETESTLLECERLLKSRKRNTGYDREELRADLDGLQAILSTIEEWRSERAL